MTAFQNCPIGQEAHITDASANVGSLQTKVNAILDLLEDLQLMDEETPAAPVTGIEKFFDSDTDEFFDSDTDEFFDS